MAAKRRTKIEIAVVVVATVTIFLALAKPGDRGGPHRGSFVALNRELQNAAPGRDVAVLDLDALDHNLAQVQSHLGPGFRLRLVTKSLPSVQLVRYLMTRAQSDRLMVFTEGFTSELLATLERPADMLFGKPLPAVAADRLLAAHPAASHIQWLVDTRERLAAYLRLAEKRQVRLRINLEIDVGLRRGGFRSEEEFVTALELLAKNADHLTLSGLMGYDGHVPFAPVMFGSNENRVVCEMAAVHQRYKKLVEAGRAAFPGLFAGALTFNSGGSRTYFRYNTAWRDQTPVNDIAMGSGFLGPAAFEGLLARGHRPASFLASPVLKRQQEAQVPFVFGLQQWLTWWNPNLAVDFVMGGGGFPGEIVSPPGLVANPLIVDGRQGVRNMVSSQANLIGSKSVTLKVGDFIFFHPWEADGLVWCESVHLIRDNKIVGQWRTYRGGP